MAQDMPSFDTLVHLAQDNPDQFEAVRKQLTDELINSAPKRMHKRLRGIQFRVDTKRRLAKNPMAACLEISKMMHQSLDELRQVLNGEPALVAAPLKAQVIELRG